MTPQPDAINGTVRLAGLEKKHHSHGRLHLSVRGSLTVRGTHVRPAVGGNSNLKSGVVTSDTLRRIPLADRSAVRARW